MAKAKPSGNLAELPESHLTKVIEGLTQAEGQKTFHRLVLAQKTRILDPEDLLEDIIGEFGGRKIFAKHLVSTFLKAPEGSIVQKGILELINRLIMFVYDQKGEGLGLEDLDTAELEAVVRGMIHAEKKTKPLLSAPLPAVAAD